MANSSVSVVPTGNKICKPFLLDVMVFSPEAGYKFHVSVERACTPEADPIWKLVFDLYKVVTGSADVSLVHVSFTAGSPVQQKALQTMAATGVKPAQADVLVNKVHPLVKAVSGKKKVSAKEKKQINDSLELVLTKN